MPARCYIVAPDALGPAFDYPPGPHADGTLLIDLDTGFWRFWNATAGAWQNLTK